jgi:hypothetical protein
MTTATATKPAIRISVSGSDTADGPMTVLLDELDTFELAVLNLRPESMAGGAPDDVISNCASCGGCKACSAAF